MGKLKVHKGLESQSGKKDQEMWFIVLFSSLGGKESTCNVGDTSSIPGLGRSPGEGIGYPFQYSGLENPMGPKQLDTTERLALHFHFFLHQSKPKAILRTLFL